MTASNVTYFDPTMVPCSAEWCNGYGLYSSLYMIVFSLSILNSLSAPNKRLNVTDLALSEIIVNLLGDEHEP